MITFTLNSIHRMVDDATFAGGEEYFARGRVVEASYDEDSGTYHGRVKGSARYIYRVELDVDRGRLVGLCSCPVGLNCKHAVATALALLQETQREAEPPAPSPTPIKKPVQPAGTAWQQWLSHLPPAPTTEPAPLEHGRHYLLYFLEEDERGAPRLSTKKAYLKKDDSWSQLRHFAPDTVNLGWNRPSHLLDEDVTILQLLPRINAAGRLGLLGEQGHRALMLLLDSGRFYLDDCALQQAAGKRLSWQWHPEDNKMQQLVANLEGVKSRDHWQLIPVTPPCYLDRESATIGDIISPLPVTQIQHLLDMPAVPENELGFMSVQLRQQIPAAQLPLPIEPELHTVSSFTPHITLVGCKLDQHRLPALKLYFDYAGFALAPPYSRHFEGQELTRERDGAYYHIRRNVDEEHRYCDAIHAQDLYLIREVLGGQEEVWLPDPSAPDDIPQRWNTLLQETLPELEKQGWVIDKDPSYQFEVDRADIALQLADSDEHWFEFGLELTLDNGRQVPIIDVVEHWLEHDAPDQLTLNVGGDWVSVNTKPLQGIHGLLLDLLKEKKLSSTVRLPGYQAAQFAEMTELDQRKAPATRKMIEQLGDYSGLENIPLPKTLNATLRPYQQDGFNWLVFLQRYGFGGILADDMGLGKTLQTLALIQHMKESGQLEKPALVVAPTSLTGNWLHEAAQFTPQLIVTLIHGPHRATAFDALQISDLVITTYPLLVRDWEHYQESGFSLAVLDEAQAIKNPTTKIAEYVRRIPCDTRLCLSGTPLENHLGELWSLMDFALPGLLGGRKTFNQVYRTPIENHGDVERQQELAHKVRPFMLRRTKTEVVAELPPKTETIQYVELGSKQRALYESVRISMEKRIRELVARQGMGKSHIEFLDALLKLRQTCIDPRLVKLDKAAGVQESAKLNWLAETLPQLLEEGRNLLIFSQFTEVLKLVELLLQDRGIDYAKLTGQTRKRQQAIDSFQNGDARVFLISLKAGGAGLNLTAADVVIHMDPWWNPAVENQATDRAYRIGQDKPVFVYKLVAENTVEERIHQMQRQKQALADSLFDATRSSNLPDSSEDLLALLGT
ncbi:DEAD/DEAH box helicase [Microbulbifer mangrovi]|uniref:DEAD/DEAH box helicase n=1 Tax=Microbulbifer mangrovi TaxID=927787 RepID=UPI001301300B|nr:DEAD/DEAH box helicase [Microbulbifer mangrovi]